MNILTNTIEDYKRWEDKKLESFTNNTDELTVQIANPNKISKPEKSMVISSLCQNNLVFFKIDNSKYRDQSSIKNLALHVGLGNYEFDSKSDLDGLTEISNNNTNTGMTEYIPYTNKELNWHKDGGLNKFLDHEIAYILFNQKSSRLNDLMLNNTYNIPKNLMTNRPEINNPVFKFNNQKLHMKFSMRKKNIIWNSSSIEASDILKNIIKDSSKYHIVKRLSEGEGVITNNVIHMRTAFTNSRNKNRLLYRLRSKKRVCI